MKIKSKWVTTAGFAYINLPLIAFVLRWTNLSSAIICLTAGLFCVYRIVKKSRTAAERDKEEYFTIELFILIGAILFFCWIGYYAGWGRFVDQADDWRKHNAVLTDMVNRKWPVYYINGDDHSMLVYYIGQYIIPALVGKIFRSVRIAEIALYIWNEIGLILVFLNILNYLKIRNFLGQLLCMLLIPLFSIPLWLSELVLKHLTGINMLGSIRWFYDYHYIKLQYSNNYTLLRWVFQQTITIWLIIILFIKYKSKVEYYVPLLLGGVMYGLFGFIGLLFLAVGGLLEVMARIKNVSRLLRKVFSPENICIALTWGLLFLTYYSGNIFSEKPEILGFNLMPYQNESISLYFIFVLVNVLPYALILLQDHKKDGIYYASVLTLLLLPLFTMGMFNDLVMRSSIPALFVFMVYLIQFINDILCKYQTPEKISLLRKITGSAAVILLLIGAQFPIVEINDSVYTDDFHTLGKEFDIDSLDVYASRTDIIREDLNYNYFAYDIENNLFYKLLARRKIK